jgi:hypothetical protein
MNADHPCPPFVDGDVHPVPLDEAQLLGCVCTAAKQLLADLRQPTANEFLEELVNRFGWRVRAVLIPAIQQLRDDSTLPFLFRSYLSATLSDEELSNALRGDAPPEHDFQSTLDDLVKKSKMFRNSAAFREAIQFVARFRDYAPFNNMLVKVQNPSCSFYASAKDWKSRFGRTIKQDVRPMLILAPMHPVMLVYELDATEGRPLPEKFELFAKVAGEFKPEILERTVENSDRHGIPVQRKKLSSTHGGFAEFQFPFFMRIVVHDELNDASAYGVLCHELAHILLGHLGSGKYGYWPSRGNLSHATFEIEAEAVSYIVCDRCGLNSASAEYLSSYIEGDQIPETVSLELITKVAGKLEQWGQRLFTPKNRKEAA